MLNVLLTISGGGNNLFLVLLFCNNVSWRLATIGFSEKGVTPGRFLQIPLGVNFCLLIPCRAICWRYFKQGEGGGGWDVSLRSNLLLWLWDGVLANMGYVKSLMWKKQLNSSHSLYLQKPLGSEKHFGSSFLAISPTWYILPLKGQSMRCFYNYSLVNNCLPC